LEDVGDILVCWLRRNEDTASWEAIKAKMYEERLADNTTTSLPDY
jgi:hypothetical protein